MQQAYPCFLSSEKNMPMTANDMKNQDFFYIPKLIISVLLNQHSVSKEQIFGSCKANTKKIIVLFSFWTWTQSQAIHPKLSEKDTLIPCHTQLNVCALAYSGVPNRRACTFINFEEKFPPAQPYLGLHVYWFWGENPPFTFIWVKSKFKIKSSKLKIAYNFVKKW